MEATFKAEQNMLSLSDCEHLCGRTSREVMEIAPHAGWQGLASYGLSLSVGASLDLLIISDAMRFGVEPQSISPLRHGLRTEALLNLGENSSNWASADEDFWPLLWGTRDVVHPRIARVLRVYPEVARRALRFHSQSEVEQLTNVMYETGSFNHRPPRFTIDAHQLASRLRSTVIGPMFRVTSSPSV